MDANGEAATSARHRDGFNGAITIAKVSFGHAAAHGDIYARLVLHGREDGQMVAKMDNLVAKMDNLVAKMDNWSRRWTPINNPTLGCEILHSECGLLFSRGALSLSQILDRDSTKSAGGGSGGDLLRQSNDKTNPPRTAIRAGRYPDETLG
jgi:hypothetical protein